jgi:hypothetical protein
MRYTCVAMPCLHYPRTEIPEGEESWVKIGTLPVSMHKDCAQATEEVKQATS